MPRKPTAAKPSAGRQATLSFNTKVTKSIPKSVKDAALSESQTTGKKVEPGSEYVEEIKPLVIALSKTAELKDIRTENDKDEVALERKSDIGIDGGKLVEDEEEEEEEEEDAVSLQAQKISTTQIKMYWRTVEKERLSKAVHQEDLRIEEKVLRYFDLSSQYGPCIGLTRLKRWQRADKVGLSPPIEVLAVLLKVDMNDGKIKPQRAHIDEILNPVMASKANASSE